MTGREAEAVKQLACTRNRREIVPLAGISSHISELGSFSSYQMRSEPELVGSAAGAKPVPQSISVVPGM